MIIIMARIIAEREHTLLLEPYGTFEDYYDDPNDELHKWVSKKQIITVDDEVVTDYSELMNTQDVLEIAMPSRIGESLL